MRAQNLRHAATGVVVRDPYGRIYVHRRTATKDVYPAHWDFTAGGGVLAGEGPLAGGRPGVAPGVGGPREVRAPGGGGLAGAPPAPPPLPPLPPPGGPH